MKKSILALALLSSAFVTAPTHAATATATFNVNITLTSKCIVDTSSAAVNFTYTSFQTTAATSTGGAVAVSCTNSLPYTLSLSNTSATDDALNLAYTLALSAGSGTGNGAAQAFTVTGTMAAGQAGTCSSATCVNTAATNKTKTLTVTY